MGLSQTIYVTIENKLNTWVLFPGFLTQLPTCWLRKSTCGCWQETSRRPPSTSARAAEWSPPGWSLSSSGQNLLHFNFEIIFRINGDVATAKGILSKEIDLLEKAGTLGKDNEKAVIIDGKTMGLVFEDPDARDLFAQLGIRWSKKKSWFWQKKCFPHPW